MNNVWVFSRKEVFVHTAFNVEGKAEEKLLLFRAPVSSSTLPLVVGQ